MAKNQVNKKGKEERIEFILDLIGEGYMTFQIVDKCMKEWKVGRRAIESYLTKVYSFLKTELNSDDKDRILMQYERLARKHEKNRPDLALKYRQQRDKITGISEKSTLDVNVKTITINLPKKKDE